MMMEVLLFLRLPPRVLQQRLLLLLAAAAATTAVFFVDVVVVPAASSVSLSPPPHQGLAYTHGHQTFASHAPLLHPQAAEATAVRGTVVTLPNGTAITAFPADPFEDHAVIHLDDIHARDASLFQLCSSCKCCDSSQSVCLQSSCCYSIDCKNPSQPFGVCSFFPTSCDCNTCSQP